MTRTRTTSPSRTTADTFFGAGVAEIGFHLRAHCTSASDSAPVALPRSTVAARSSAAVTSPAYTSPASSARGRAIEHRRVRFPLCEQPLLATEQQRRRAHRMQQRQQLLVGEFQRRRLAQPRIGVPAQHAVGAAGERAREDRAGYRV